MHSRYMNSPIGMLELVFQNSKLHYLNFLDKNSFPDIASNDPVE